MKNNSKSTPKLGDQSEINTFQGCDQKGVDTSSTPAISKAQLGKLMVHNRMIARLCTRLNGAAAQPEETPLVADPLALKRGQVWGDRDPRRRGRYFLVKEVAESGARCVDLRTGKVSRISNKRLRQRRNYFLAVDPSLIPGFEKHIRIPGAEEDIATVEKAPRPARIHHISV